MTAIFPAGSSLVRYSAPVMGCRAEIKVSHVYRSKQYRKEGLEKSRKLKEYFIEQGIEPSRIKNKTFLDRRSKYPHNSPFRKVLVVLTNIKPEK